MNTAAIIHALAAITIPAENLIFLLFRIVANVNKIFCLCAIGLGVSIVINMIYRQEKRLRLSAAGAFIAKKSKEFACAFFSICRTVLPLEFYSFWMMLTIPIIFAAVNSFAFQAKTIGFSASDNTRIVSSPAKSFHCNRIAQTAGPYVL